jgi:glycosyltransferase involved in cell wall biosynthesis
MQKKILMLLPNGFDPDPRVHNEARSLVEAGYLVTILCWDRDVKYKEHEDIDGIRIERIFVSSSYGRGSSQLRYLWRFWKEAYQRALIKTPDVIHSHDFNTLPLGYWLGKILKIPVIFDAHESYHEMLADNVYPVIKWTIARIERFLIKRIDLLITVGSILEEEYKRRGAKRTIVIGNWKRLEDFRFSEAEIKNARKELGIPENCLIISFIGYLLPSRGLLTLIEAVRSDKEVFLVIGGKGQLEDKIEELAGNVENILYLGYTIPERIPLITVLSDVIYYGLEGSTGNSRYSAPNKLFEALAAGKVILTGKVGEIARIVKEEKCGIRLNKFSKETLLDSFKKLRNVNLINTYKDNAHQAGINKYNWSNAEKTLLGVYDKIVNNRANIAMNYHSRPIKN